MSMSSFNFLQVNMYEALAIQRWRDYNGDLCSGGPGLWPVPTDCAGYVLCIAGPEPSNAILGRLLHCPPHTAFSAELGTCVAATQVEGCGEQADEDNTGPVRIRVHSRQRRGAEEVQLAEGEDGCDAGVLGATCADCDRLVVCAQLNGTISPIASVSCNSLEGTNRCSGKTCVQSDTPCDVGTQQQFRCLEPGIFPDPVEWRRYHLCGPDLGHISDTCVERYDPDSKSCVEIPKDATTPPTEKPLNCGDEQNKVHALAHAPAYYALCVPSVTPATEGKKGSITYQISVLACPERQVFDDKILMCRFSCGGRRGRLPLEGSCRSYIECSSERAQPRRMTCGRGLAFDAKRQMCLPESQVAGCSSKEIITSPPPVTSRATTATSQMKQTASSPTQATPMTPLVINIPVTPNPVCISEGRFIDHSNCRRYIHCWRAWDGALTMAMRWCPPFTYFEPITSACRIGFC